MINKTSTFLKTSYMLYPSVKTDAGFVHLSSMAVLINKALPYNPHSYSSLILRLVCQPMQTLGADIEVPNQCNTYGPHYKCKDMSPASSAAGLKT